MDTMEKLKYIKREVEDLERELGCIAEEIKDMHLSGELLEFYGEYPADYIEEDIIGNLAKARTYLHKFWAELL